MKFELTNPELVKLDREFFEFYDFVSVFSTGFTNMHVAKMFLQ